MLNKLGKIEEKINAIIGKLLAAILGLFSKIIHKVIPQSFFDKVKAVKNNSKEKTIQKLNSFKEFNIRKYKELNQGKDKLFDKINEVQNYPVKGKLTEKFILSKNYLITTPPKEQLKAINQGILAPFKKLTTKIKSLKSFNLKLAAPISILVFLGVYGIYIATIEIYKSEFPSREPASVQEYDYRPDYRLYNQKTLKILNVKVPIFVESVGEVDSITIDFSLRLSTRFSRHYLVEYEYKLKDYFFTGVEPVISDFPMQEEGKQVLKEKIEEEINNFLYDNNVEGFVEEVNILYMVGS